MRRAAPTARSEREVEGRILQITPVVSIVDDDKAVRLALGSLIRSLGWQARMYESAGEFLSSGEAAQTSCLISVVFGAPSRYFLLSNGRYHRNN